MAMIECSIVEHTLIKKVRSLMGWFYRCSPVLDYSQSLWVRNRSAARRSALWIVLATV